VVGMVAHYRPVSACFAFYGAGWTVYTHICHQLDGEGTKVGPDLTAEGTRGRSAAWLMGHFKDPTLYVPRSVMPSFKNLTDEQLSALTAFLESQKGGEN
jgi:cbb3-type cytochrome oxidase cytochrome c subunit